MNENAQETQTNTKIEKEIFENTLKYQGEDILKYYIEEAGISKSDYLFGEEVFNNYNRKLTLELQHESFTYLFREARDLYNDSKIKDFLFHPYEINSGFTVPYNKDQFVSLFTDTYIFAGGAHGKTIRSAQNWDLQDGKQYTLADLYPNNPNYKETIIQEIIKQIAENPDTYFENYADLVKDTFQEQNFYRSGDHEITVFFQQYDIAPYSTGIPTFKIEF